MDVSHLRQDYRTGALRRADLAPNPFDQFGKWFEEASGCAAITEPNAMSLGTAGSDGMVTVRTVLLKAWDEKGFVFFTNTRSGKSRQIGQNPQVALLFAWLALERQVSITGTARQIPREDSAAYFASRPAASQIGAWASEQSSRVSSREILEAQFEAVSRKFSGKEIPLPENWGGYCVVPQTIEFWQGRRSRLHDRFLYSRQADGAWNIERLSP